jgi:hypothetical protein
VVAVASAEAIPAPASSKPPVVTAKAIPRLAMSCMYVSPLLGLVDGRDGCARRPAKRAEGSAVTANPPKRISTRTIIWVRTCARVSTVSCANARQRDDSVRINRVPGVWFADQSVGSA